MKKTSLLTLFSVMAMFGLESGLMAQNRVNTSSVAERYLISAKAGGVNYVEGSVSIVRPEGKSGILMKGDQVEIGDQVSTGTDGRAEVLLNPGSYIRLGAHSSFEFGTTDLEDLQIRLDAGNALFEVFAANEFRVTVFTPKGKVALIETGVYRIDVATDGSGILSVTKGQAEVGDSKVKDGQTGTIGINNVTIAKFDKGKRDALGEWSRNRAKELTKITSSLRNDDVGSFLSTSFYRGQWGIHNSFGLWMYSSAFGRYCFMPFGSGWSSPYGYGYRTGIYWYNLPTVINLPSPVTPRKGSQITRILQGAPNVETKSSSRDSRVIGEPPPFTKVGRGGGKGERDVFNSRDRDFSPERSVQTSSPAYFPPSSAPAAPTSGGKGSRVIDP